MLPPIGGVGEVFPLETGGYHPPTTHWPTLAVAKWLTKRGKGQYTNGCCDYLCGDHYLSPAPHSPSPHSGSLPPHSGSLLFSHTPLPPRRLQPNQKLQRLVLLSRAVQEKMAAVSRSCLHICQKVTVQEKMGFVVCRLSASVLLKPACEGNYWICVFFFLGLERVLDCVRSENVLSLFSQLFHTTVAPRLSCINSLWHGCFKQTRMNPAHSVWIASLYIFLFHTVSFFGVSLYGIFETCCFVYCFF